jgi:hypothetical protein
MESDLLAWCLKARDIIESTRTIRKGGWFEAPPMVYFTRRSGMWSDHPMASNTMIKKKYTL